MIHPHTRLGFVSEEIGCGVFATKFIPKGTITWVLDDLDQRLDETYINSLEPLRQKQVRKYGWRDNKGQYILSWDIAQFINHSFKASCMITPYEFEVAIRDIYPGEEITDDYAFCNEDEPFECLPEAGITRTKVMPDDLLYFYPEWDLQLAEAMLQVNTVNQPLKYLISQKYLNKINAIVEGREPVDSVVKCYYDRAQTLELTY
jgi:uncharacterized protein